MSVFQCKGERERRGGLITTPGTGENGSRYIADFFDSIYSVNPYYGISSFLLKHSYLFAELCFFFFSRRPLFFSLSVYHYSVIFPFSFFPLRTFNQTLEEEPMQKHTVDATTTTRISAVVVRLRQLLLSSLLMRYSLQEKPRLLRERERERAKNRPCFLKDVDLPRERDATL